MIFLVLVVIQKKSICIDSTTVEKIDIVINSTNEVNSIYGCHLNKKINYSIELADLNEQIESKTNKAILVLNSILSFKKPIQIKLYIDEPYKFQITDEVIHLGKSYLNLEQHLSRALIKLWINQNRSKVKFETIFYEESIVDLLLFIIDGKIELEDPSSRLRTKVGSAKWPQVIKNISGYCHSAWKYTEHIDSCLENKNTNFQASIFPTISKNLVVAGLSLRPLLTSALIKSYTDFTFAERNRFIKNIPDLLMKINLTSDKAIEALLIDENPLHHGLTSINKFKDLILSADTNSQSEIYRLYAGVTQYLQEAGVTETYAEANFDFMIEYNGQLDSKSHFFKNLEAAAFLHQNIQVAVKDSSHIWILPSKTALPENIFNKLHSKQLIYVSCPINSIRINDYFQKAEKLMLINFCDQTVKFKFESLFTDGIKAFIAENSKFNFIQLHLPSLEMIKEEFNQNPNFFEMVKNRDLNAKGFKRLGWSKIQWSTDLKAYQPEAIIDAIEYYRN